MTFYKACKYVKFNDDIIVEKFIKGQHAYWNKYKQLQLESLPEGMTKYNKEIYLTFRDLQKDFRNLITIQSMLITFVQDYIPGSQGKIRNIWRIRHSQKGTIDFYDVLLSALKKYQVRHQNVYDALKREITKDTDRLQRNTIFIDSTIKDCGLECIANAIRKDYDKSVFEHAKEFSKNFSIAFQSNEDFFEARDKAYKEEIEKIAAKHNIDLATHMNQAEDQAKEHRKAIQEDIKANKKAYRIKTKQSLADSLNLDHNINLFKAIENANETQYLSQLAYEKLISALKAMNGTCYFVSYVSGKTLQFYKADGKLTQTMTNVAYFADANDETIFNAVKELQRKNDEAIVSIEKISHDAFKMGSTIKLASLANADDKVQADILEFTKSIDNCINSPLVYHHTKLAQLALLCMNRDTNKLYYVCIVNDKNKIYGGKPLSYKYENICAKSFSDMEFVTSRENAEILIELYKENEDNTAYKFSIHSVEFNDPTRMIIRIQNEINTWKDKLISSLEEYSADRNWQFAMTPKSIHMMLRHQREEHNHLKILIRKSLEINPEILTYSCDENNQFINIESNIDVHNTSFEKRFTKRMIISTSDAGDKIFNDIINTLQTKDNTALYQIVDLPIDLESDTYKAGYRKFLKTQYTRLQEIIKAEANNDSRTQSALTIQNKLAKSDTLYFIYVFDTPHMKFVHKNCKMHDYVHADKLRLTLQPQDICYFSSKNDAIDMMVKLSKYHSDDKFFIGEYTHENNNLPVYKNLCKGICKEAKTITKQIKHSLIKETSHYFASQEQLDRLITLTNTHENVYLAFRKQVNSLAQIYQIESDEPAVSFLNLDMNTLNSSLCDFNVLINKSVIYVTTQEDAKKLEDYLNTLDSNHVYMVHKI